jgi:hypothetical protein
MANGRLVANNYSDFDIPTLRSFSEIRGCDNRRLAINNDAFCVQTRTVTRRFGQCSRIVPELWEIRPWPMFGSEFLEKPSTN